MSLPLTHAGGSVDGISAALDLRFASSLSLTSTSGITPSFSRASTGTFFNSSGVLTTAAINAPRFNHVYNGSSWVSKGLLVEEQRTNSVQWSEDFSNATWSKLRTSISANAFASPDGNTTADKLVEDSSASNTHLVLTVSSITASVFSIYAKAAERSWIALQKSNTGNFCYFNLSSGTVGSASGATGSINSVGNGWYRCTIAVTSGSSVWDIFLATGDNGASYTGNGTSGLYIWGAQLETGTFPTSYIPTTTAAVTRSADVCQITGGDFSSFWNASEGSFVTEADSIGFASTGSDRYIIAFNSGGTANISHAIFLPTPGLSFDVYNSTLQARLSYTQPNAGDSFKLASCYKANDFAATLNGSAVQTDTSGTVPTINNVGIGYYPSYGQYANCHIARLRYFNKRLTNNQLEDLCKPEQQLKLDLNFSSNLSLTPTVGPTPSYSRASTGTYFNASGVLTSAAINAPRFDHVYDGTNWISKGLLIEEQRTNLATYSEDFSNAAYGISGVTVLANQVAAPDGNTTADKLTMTSSGTFYQSPLYGSAGAQAGSVWLRADSTQTVMLRIANDSGGESTTSTVTVTTSWQRFSVARTFAANPIKIWFGIDQRSILGGPNVAATIYGWGYQIESGSFPTSYIPTVASSVTRSADVCQITGSAFTNLWNASEGSIVADYDIIGRVNAVGDATMIWQADDSTLNNRLTGIAYETTSLGVYKNGFFAATSGAGQANFYIADPGLNSAAKLGLAWKVNDFYGYSGGVAGTDSSGSIPAVTQIKIGSRLGDYFLCGHIARLRYYAIRLPNRLLIAKST